MYVKQPNTETPAFMLHQVELGPSLGDSYVVVSGINDGDEIVTNGAFTIDASAQLEGKRSMMNEDSARPATGHEGHNMTGNSHDMNHHENPDHNTAKNIQTEKKANTEQSIISVQGLCEICKSRIEKAAKSVNGVILATWNEKSKQLQLNFDPTKTSINEISKAIANAGHDTNKYKAPNAVYDALPSCCKYRVTK